MASSKGDNQESSRPSPGNQSSDSDSGSEAGSTANADIQDTTKEAGNNAADARPVPNQDAGNSASDTRLVTNQDARNSASDARVVTNQDAGNSGINARVVPNESLTVVPVPSDNVTVQPSVSSAPRICTSGSSSLCRICQLNREESALSLETSQCSCRGSLSKVHKLCLERWVLYRGSNLCEICGSRFVAVPNPARAGAIATPEVTPPDNYYFQTLETIRLQLMQVQPINRRKRTALAGFLVFLVLITVVTAILTVGADRDFQNTNSNPWASDADLRKTHIVFSICLSFLFFCLTLTIGLTLMWIAVELYLHIRRRQIFRAAAERLVNVPR